jgi:predicted outer membrane repeat protein
LAIVLALGASACGGGDSNDAAGGGGGTGATSGSGGAGGSGNAGGSGGSSGTGGSATGGTGGTNPNLDCPGKLDPEPAKGQIETVGDGTAASCTEQALNDAVGKVNAAQGGGTVKFDCGGAHTITLTKSVFVSNTMILDGGGEITLSGGGAVRVVELDHYVDFVIQRITIKDGYVPAGAANESGAGLLSPWFGTLEAIDVTFDNNVSASTDHDVGGGAIYAGGLTKAVLSGCKFTNNSGSTGGGVLSRSTNLSVANCVFSGNSATTYADSGQYGNGGGLYIDRMWLDAPTDFSLCGSVFDANHAKVHGSALFVYDLEGSGASIDRCTFSNNDMAGSPGGGTGSVYYEGVPLTLTASTFSNNQTGAHAGGLFLGGGSDASVQNCTFVGNKTPGNAGALWVGNGNVTVESSTFAKNDADYGPVFFKGQSGSLKLTNVVIADNTTANQYSALACHETFDDGGGNIQWPDKKNNGNPDTPCTSGVSFADPGLADLADNGGPTLTMALSAGSPAVDVSKTCPEYDQRGMPRAGLCDSGAYELQP